MTGLVPIFLRTQQALMESLIESFGLAFAIIAVVMIVMLRSIGGGLFSMLPNLQPIFIIFGFISMAGMRTDMGTMITASVALGIAVDGTLHLLTWFREYLIRGKTRTEAICAALSHCAPAMSQTSLIISLGLVMLFPATLLLIVKFGTLMAALIMMALFGDIVFLPALLAGPMGKLIENSVQREKRRRSLGRDDDGGDDRGDHHGTPSPNFHASDAAELHPIEIETGNGSAHHNGESGNRAANSASGRVSAPHMSKVGENKPVRADRR